MPIALIAPIGTEGAASLEAVRPIDRAWRPVYAVWELTLACDQACIHCGSRAGRARPRELDTRECLALVEELAALGVREVTLIGGEAYLRDDWLDVVAALSRREVRVGLTTGGRAFEETLARRAAAAGLDSVAVSIDGLEAAHDKLRGRDGSFSSATAALAAARRAGIPSTVNTQINRVSWPDLAQLVELIANLGATGWQIQLTVPMGRAADLDGVLLEPYDLLELFPLLAQLAERCRNLGIRFWPGNNVGYFGPYESELRTTSVTGHWLGCGAGRTTIGIEADGTIKGCPSLPTASWAAANIRDISLLEIWEGTKPMRYTRERTRADLWGFCQTCYYGAQCLAGCTWTSDVTLGRPGNNPYCHHRALEHAREGLRERLVRVERAPGEPFDRGRFEIVVEKQPASAEARS